MIDDQRDVVDHLAAQAARRWIGLTRERSLPGIQQRRLARPVVQAHAVGEAEQPPAGVVHEDEPVLRVEHGDALVDQVDDRLQARRLVRHLALQPRRFGDVVEHRQHAGRGPAVRGRQRHGVDEARQRAPLDVEQQLGADDGLVLGQRAGDGVHRGRQRFAVTGAEAETREVLGERTADVAVGAQDLDRGGVGELDDAVGADDEHGFDQRVEDRPEDALHVERPAGFRAHVDVLSGLLPRIARRSRQGRARAVRRASARSPRGAPRSSRGRASRPACAAPAWPPPPPAPRSPTRRDRRGSRPPARTPAAAAAGRGAR